MAPGERPHSFHNATFRNGNYHPKNEHSFSSKRVFVAMPLKGEGTDEVYNAIEDECRRLSLVPSRVVDNTGSGLIIKEIAESIEIAEFIIFDLTYERPSVYYELGYAHGIGNESNDILLVAKQGTEIRFDIAQRRIAFYTSTEELRSIVRRNLTAMLKAHENANTCDNLQRSGCKHRWRETEKLD